MPSPGPLSFALSAALLLWSSTARAQQDPTPPEVDIVTGAQPSVPPPSDPLPSPVVSPAVELPPRPPAAPADTPAGPRQIGPKAVRSLASRLTWRFPEFRPYQYVLIGVQGLAAVASVAIPGEPRFVTSNPLDDAIRDGIRVADREGNRWARDASDVGLVLLLNQRLVDDLIVTWWIHDKGSTAWQMSMIDLQALTFAASINSLTAGLVGRERPYGRAICQEGPEALTNDCLGNNRYRSYFSGHATAAFTVAGLTCAHHIELPLYGGGPVEAVPCVTSMLLAGGVATLRMASDQHYFTDVLTGAAWGTASGFAIPYLFHYMHDDSPLALRGAGMDVVLLPRLDGVTVAGEF